MSSEFLDQPLSFARSKSRQELELIVSVLMVDKQVNVDSGCVDSFHIYLNMRSPRVHQQAWLN